MCWTACALTTTWSRASRGCSGRNSNPCWRGTMLWSSVEKIKAELDEAQLSEKQLKRKLELQTEILRNKMEELRLVTERTHETMSSELMELQEERMELEAVKATLEQALQEAQYIDQHLELTNTNLQC